MGDSAIHALAGSLGGCVAMTLTYPLVTLSTQAAVQSKKTNVPLPEAIAKVIKKDGLSGLYAGLDSSLAGIALTNGIYYLFYEESRAAIIKRRTGPNLVGALSTLEGILAGLIAGSVTSILTNPIWTIQTYQSTRAVAVPSAEGGDAKTVRKIKPGLLESAQEILAKDGYKGFFRGVGPALVLVCNPVIQYTTFERLISLLLTYRTRKAGALAKPLGRGALSDWDIFMLSALAKLVATGGTYPIIVVKSRLQAATHKYKSLYTAIMSILKDEGLHGLYAGLLPKLLQSMLTAAFMFVAQRRIFEAVKKATLLVAAKKGLAASA